VGRRFVELNNEQKHRLNRRTFLKTGVQASAAAAVLGSASTTSAKTTKSKSISLPTNIPQRKFGKTGHVLPVYGQGGSAFVSDFKRFYKVDILSDEERIQTIRHAYDKGVRYFDTARDYREGERIFGEALRDVRDDVYLATKTHFRDPAETRRSVETSLTELGMDFVDCMQIHTHVPQMAGYDGTMLILDELEKMREEGLFRFIGLTTHEAFEVVYQVINTGRLDQVLLARGYFHKGLLNMLSHKSVEWREKCVAKAHELQMGIVAMKVLGACIFGHNAKNLVPDYEDSELDKLPAAAIRWAAQDERISMLLIGASYPGDIDKNVATFTNNLAYTDEDKTRLAHFSSKAYESEFVKGLRYV